MLQTCARGHFLLEQPHCLLKYLQIDLPSLVSSLFLGFPLPLPCLRLWLRLRLGLSERPLRPRGYFSLRPLREVDLR